MKNMDRGYFHWGATADNMEIIRRRRKSPKTLRQLPDCRAEGLQHRREAGAIHPDKPNI